MQRIIERHTGKEIEDCPSIGQRFLYRSILGRCILKILICPFVTKLSGAYMNSRMSRIHIKRFIKKNHICMEDYPQKKYKSFNDFFTRKILADRRPIVQDSDILISPCDSKLSVFKLDKAYDETIFVIKGAYYTLSDLLNYSPLAKQYENGYCLIFRLGVTDYHRYGYIDEGNQEKNISVPGVFHTVHPISLEKYNFFKRNHRSYTVLHTKNFKDVVQVEVGAMMVGRIKNHFEDHSFTKGEEKGYFMFGGSTIILLIQDIVTIDEDILMQSQKNNEITVRYGERIGKLK
ncbi:MAG: phosphatidylserine decarboxylase [Acholeplasmatales bacterium]|jgi:phosphatidylserine decarboxylase|nr:phosphatidylserine decarboxylase [Acholeplasmatales bacterium]